MINEKFFPDTISSDIHAMCLDGPAHDLVTTMSKFLNLGMPIYDIIKSCTLNASSAINRPEIGKLEIGSVANISILKIEQGNFKFFDVTNQKLIGKEKIIAKGVVLNGELWHFNEEINQAQ